MVGADNFFFSLYLFVCLCRPLDLIYCESVSILGNSTPIENGVNHVKLLPASNDDHEGVIVYMKEPMEPDVFLTLLRASLSLWRQQVFVTLVQFYLSMPMS